MRKPQSPVVEKFLSSTVTIPNILSAFRILLVPLFVWLILSRNTFAPLLIFCIAGITDLFDGFIARHLHQRSNLGVILDPAGDKLLMAASYIVLALPRIAGPNRVPLWLTVIVFGRDLMIVGGVLWAYLTFRIGPVLPTIIGKLTTAFQVGTIFLVLLTNHLRKEAGGMIFFYGITAGLTLASWIIYFLRGLRILRERNGSGSAGPAVS
ncbi:MAG: CDP-alcohol phosphatidyltransferase family protein [Candidatus Aminicenantales bacterium]